MASQEFEVRALTSFEHVVIGDRFLMSEDDTRLVSLLKTGYLERTTAPTEGEPQLEAPSVAVAGKKVSGGTGTTGSGPPSN